MIVLPIVKRAERVWADARTALQNVARDESGQAALVIITIVIVAAGIAISQMSVQNNRRGLDVSQAQRANFERITTAIEAYAVADIGSGGAGSFLLPCPAVPADGDGQAVAHVGTDCTGRNRGIVPWEDLGLSEQDVVDINGNFLTYIVHSTDVEACNGTMAGTDSLNDLNGSMFAYALIAHGSNGAGAYNSFSNTEVNGGSASSFEDDNCTAEGTCSGVANTFRSGPQNPGFGNTYFDDIVRAVSFEESFTLECPALNDEGCDSSDDDCLAIGSKGDEEGTPVAERSGPKDLNGENVNEIGALNAIRLTQGTANNAGNNTNNVGIDIFDPNGTSDSGDETIAFTFINNDNFPTRACRFLEPTIPLTGHTIRVYSRVFFEADAAGDQGLGNGLVFGFLAHKDTAGDAVFIDNTTCGGTDSALGFGEDTLGNTFDGTIERFGIEIDTFNHRPDPGPPTTATNIYDPDFNHIAVVLGNVNHEDGDDPDVEGDTSGSGTGAGDDGPVCRALAQTTDGDPTSFGVAPEDRGGVGTGTFENDRHVSATTAEEGCLYNELDANWLENGHPTADGTFAEGNDVRIELHGHSANDCGAGQFLLSAWVYEASENCTNCDDLSQDFADIAPTGQELPHISMCISQNDLDPAADDPLEDLLGVRFFVSQGFAASGASIGGRISVDRVEFRREKIDGANKPIAADYAQTIDITENEVRDYFYNTGIPGGNLSLDQSYVRINQDEAGAQTLLFEQNYDDAFDTGISITSSRGTFFLDLNDGLGVVGVGVQSQLDTIDPSGGSNFLAFDTYLETDARERISFEFDQQYRRFTVNLRNFGAVNNGGYTGSETEKALIRAFNGDNRVGSDLNVNVCAENEGTVGNAAGMTINHDFGGLFDRVQIIPVPADETDDEAHTRIIVGAVKACGADMPCAFNPQGNEGDETRGFAFSDTGINSTEAECHQVVPWPVNTTALGSTADVQAARARAYLAAPANFNTQRTWIDFNDYDTDEGGVNGIGADANAMDVNILTQAGNLQIHDTGAASAGGFGINGIFGTTARIDSDDDAAAGQEEEMSFRFNNDWSQAMVRINRFNDLGGGDLEQAIVAFYNDNALVESHTVSPCVGADTDGNWRKELTITPSANFDEIRVSANDTTISGASSDIYVNAIRACDLISGADCGGVTHGDNSAQASQFCTQNIP